VTRTAPSAGGVVVAENCSKWYGHVLGVSDVSWRLRGGIVGLLGPNGAGKSTLIKMMAGLLRPSRGSLAVFGKSPFDDVGVRRRIGYAPEHDKTWDELTALELVTFMARLAGVDRQADAADDLRAAEALAHVLQLQSRRRGRGAAHLSSSGFSRRQSSISTAIASHSRLKRRHM